MDSGIFGIGIWELALIFIIMLAVAGPKRMIKWAYDLGRITTKVRAMFQETMESFKRELEDSDPELAKDLRELPKIVSGNQRFDIVKEANKLVGDTITAPVNSKYTSSTTGDTAATTLTTAANSASNETSDASTQSDDAQSRYDAWQQN